MYKFRFLTEKKQQNDSFPVVMWVILFIQGEIPDLFPDDEVENIIGSLRPEVRGSGVMDTRENCWKFFIDRVRRQLKVNQSDSQTSAGQRVVCVLCNSAFHC